MTPARRRLRVMVAVLVMGAAASCGAPSFQRAERADPPEGTVEVGDEVQRPVQPEDAPPGTVTAHQPTKATAIINVRDPRGPARSGIPVLVEGPVKMRLRSGRGGVVDVSGPPGRYRVSIETGCADELQVRRGATGSLGLAEGDVARGDLTAEAGSRYKPASGVYWREGGEPGSGRADWRHGEIHLVDLALEDACPTGSSPHATQGARLGRLRFVPGPGVEVIAAPTKVGPGGRVQLQLRCTGQEVDVVLDLVDSEIPEDRLPVFGREALKEQLAPYCTSPG